MALLPSSPTATLSGRFTERHATRLLWRAGFGPRPGEARRLAAAGLDGAVASLTRIPNPAHPARLVGRPPRAEHGRPLDPVNVWGDDHCWWLDRMVRSDQPLTERMTLVWHGWLTSSVEGATAELMLAQNRMMRSRALGSFHDLLVAVTRDPAMLLWLSGVANNKYAPNENYARELMELFTLGADRGYSQKDVHNQARALTGFTASWGNSGPRGFRFDADLHDPGVKTIFGHRGRFGWRDSCRLCVEHPRHPSFMVSKLWGYFVGEPIPGSTLKVLERTYVSSGYEVRPLMEAILRHPLFYEGARLVTPPVVFCAGMLRALGQTITTDAWGWIGDQTGQKLFEPPNVAGWDYEHWLDTSRWASRLTAVNTALSDSLLDTAAKHYPTDEKPGMAVTRALAHWGAPELSPDTMDNLLTFSRRAQRAIRAEWEQVSYRILRQNALRALIPMTPDWQAR
jgi:uncharacterized protein (DUF1800 family)